MMKKLIRKHKTTFFLLTLSAFYGGCASAPFKVVSEPDQAEVFIVDKESKERKSIGLTPILKKKKELAGFLEGQNTPGELINIVIEKDGFKTKNVWIPTDAGGSLGTSLNIKLAEGISSTEEMRTAKQLVDKLFLSQQYARTQQFERALIEIDKILEQYPDFDRAMTMKGAILFGQGAMKDSLVWYEKALGVNPELKMAMEMSAKIRQKLRLPARSIASRKLPTKLPLKSPKSSNKGARR